MAYVYISGIAPQLQKDAAGTTASGYYLKGYAAGTTTPLSMGTDDTPSATLAKCKLNTRGEPISNDADETTVFIPTFNAAYRLVLYANSTDADANTFASAVWDVDNLSGAFDATQINYTSSATVTQKLNNLDAADYTELRAITTSQLADNDHCIVRYRASENDGGGGTFHWDASDLSTEVTADTQSGIYAAPDSDNTGASGAWVRNDIAFITPEMFGVVPNAATSQTTAMQAFLDYVRDNGVPGRGTGGGTTYRCDTAITLQSNINTAKSINIDWCGSIIDFSNTVLTSGDLCTIGAEEQNDGHDKEIFVFKSFKIVGPEAAGAKTTNDNATTITTLKVVYAFHIEVANAIITQSYIGIETEYVFPGDFKNIEVRESYIPYRITSFSTLATWTLCGAVDSYFSFLVQPDTVGDQITSQTFINPRIENCERGHWLDPLDGTGTIDGISYIQPYFENVTGHHITMGTAFDFTDAVSDGTNRTAQVLNYSVRGGLWSSGAWSATKAPICFSTTSTVVGGAMEIPAEFGDVIGTPVKFSYVPLIDKDSGLGMNWSPFKSNEAYVVFAGATAAISAEYGNVAATSVTRVSTGVYDINLDDAYAGANSIIATGTCDVGKVACDTANSTSTSARINCFDNSSSPALFDPSRVRVFITGILT